MDQISRASRRPSPPVILYKDDDWTKPLDPPKLWIPDSTTFEVFLPTTVTWYFENIEDYTVEPYVAEVPRVDFLGHTDRKSKSLLFEAFYLYGLQLVPGDLDFMEREGFSLVKLVDTLVKLETGDAENVFTRIFNPKKMYKEAGLMWLPFLHGSGLSAKLGYTPGPAFEPLPVYPGPITTPPPYVPVEDQDADPDEDADNENDESVVDEPPSYESSVIRVTTASVKWPVVNTVGVHVHIEKEVDTQIGTENQTWSEPDAQSADAAQPESTATPALQPTKLLSHSRKWLRLVRDFFQRR
ncbi:hypothetical protein HD806DRAFT_531380 [Xylariaceae sp. AK1471]|nr:hypothetical protein HD806DRAFT_531380 [Xylariaceae sp. AK1471]